MYFEPGALFQVVSEQTGQLYSRADMADWNVGRKDTTTSLQMAFLQKIFPKLKIFFSMIFDGLF